MTYHEQRPEVRRRVTELYEQCKQGRLALDDAVAQQMLIMDTMATPTVAVQHVTQHPLNRHMALTDDVGGGLCLMLYRWFYMLLHFVGYTAKYIFGTIAVIVVLRYSLPIFGHVAAFLWKYT
jgi:hypothetical protein